MLAPQGYKGQSRPEGGGKGVSVDVRPPTNACALQAQGGGGDLMRKGQSWIGLSTGDPPLCPPGGGGSATPSLLCGAARLRSSSGPLVRFGIGLLDLQDKEVPDQGLKRVWGCVSLPICRPCPRLTSIDTTRSLHEDYG